MIRRGINFERTVQRKNEVSLWMGWPRNQGLQRMSNAGHVRGIRNASQGVGLDVKPYLLGLTESFPGRDDSPSATDVQAGVDVFYSVTPSLKANRDGQHRLCADRSRPAPDQPDAVFPVLPGEA